MRNLLENLKKEGFCAEATVIHNFRSTGEEISAIIVDTDYEGPYPTEAVFKMHEKIRNLCRKDRGKWIVDPHVMKVSVRIFSYEDVVRITGETLTVRRLAC